MNSNNMTPEELQAYNVNMTAGLGPLDIMQSKKDSSRFYLIDPKTHRIFTQEENDSHKIMEIDMFKMAELEGISVFDLVNKDRDKDKDKE